MFHILIDGKSKRINIRKTLNEEILEQLNTLKLGTLRISNINNKLIAQIAVEAKEKEANGSNSMGVDLGLKVPAVAVIDSGKTKFFGKGKTSM